MINSSDIPGMLAIDAQGVDKLRLQAKKEPDQALKGAARQFEALFMNMLLKSMREATPKDGMFDSEQTRFYTSMLDQQFAQSLSAKGIGLADIMIRQLSRSVIANAQGPSAPAAPAANMTPTPQSGVSAPGVSRNVTLQDRMFDNEQTRLHTSMLDQLLMQNPPPKRINSMIGPSTRSVAPDVPQPSAPAAAPAAPAANTALAPRPGAFVPSLARDFVNRVLTFAREASEATGIPAHFVVAQAALESGWGRHEIRRADGSQSFNLFGIKAGRSWSGPVVEKATTEYVNGVAQTTVGKFRAYSSYAEGFRDHAKLLLNNPRYAAVLDRQDAAGFARGLQRAGYATDPGYADKLTRILNGNVLRQSLTLKA